MVLGSGPFSAKPKKLPVAEGVWATRSIVNEKTVQGEITIAPGYTKPERQAANGTMVCVLQYRRFLVPGLAVGRGPGIYLGGTFA